MPNSNENLSNDGLGNRSSRLESQESIQEDYRSSRSTSALNEPELILSKRRWFIFFATGVLGFSLTTSTVTAPVLSQLLNLLGLNVDQYIYISQISNYLMAVVLSPTAILVDKFGIRKSIFASVGFLTTAAIFKILLYFPNVPGWRQMRLFYFLLGNWIAVQASAIYILLPLKISETWFSESERSLAWSGMNSQVLLASGFISILLPRIISGNDDFKYLAYLILTVTVASIIVSISCVSRSEPLHPPSLRMLESSKDIVPFTVAIKRMIGHKRLLQHVFHSSIYESVNGTLNMVIQDVLLSAGFSQKFAGNYMSVTAIFSILMLLVTASFIHRIQNITLACKVGSFIQTFLFVILLLAITMSWPGWLLILLTLVLLAAVSWTIPNFNNMTAQLSCGSVSQATIVGFSLVLGTIVMSIMQVTFAYLTEIEQDNKTNYTKSFIALTIFAIINETIYLVFFKLAPEERESNNDQSPIQDDGNVDDQSNHLRCGLVVENDD